jgi:glycosyltransferase involved in cell wall biosynthesis
LSNQPGVSVVMPVKNARPYLDAAVESILSQTHRDFEFIIRDDHSTDGSLERLRFWAGKDKRIRLFEGEQSLGPSGSSNWVVEQARTPLVARMDADDISRPDRLERQLAILEDNPDAVLVGSVFEGIDRKGRVVREPDLSVLASSRFAAPFAHGSIMFRRAAFERAGGYRSACDFWEDLDLSVRMASLGRILVMLDPLYQHRFAETSTRLTSSRSRVLDSVDRMFICRRMHERGEDYSPLLAREPAPHRRHRPDTFLSLGSISLWSGLRPRTLSQILTRAELRFDRSTARAIAWALWAAIAPRSLRYILQQRLRMKNNRARQELAGRHFCEWQVRGVKLPEEQADAEASLPLRA